MISRRLFLALTGTTILARPASSSENEVPALLDHILLGCKDLDRGIDFVEARSGVRAAFGGVHPGVGTRNALLSLGERRYLEIIAPDPTQDTVKPYAVQQLTVIKQLTTPRLIGWAAHPGDIETFAKTLRESGVAIEGPRPGSRVRFDGRVLNWKTLNLADDRHGLLPFFIEWGTNSVHPSSDAPAGCHIERFAVADQDNVALALTFQRFGIDTPVEHGEKPQLRARLAGPRGRFELSS
jgi:hypothetical protein